jgi:hypothetical protein
VAQRLVHGVDALLACRAASEKAPQLALLKRELARGHAALLGDRSEENYLAIVILAEGVLAATYWQDLTPDSLKLLRSALAVGLESRAIEYSDYQDKVRCLHANGVRSGPTFELGEEPGGLREPDTSGGGNDEPEQQNGRADPVR